MGGWRWGWLSFNINFLCVLFYMQKDFLLFVLWLHFNPDFFMWVEYFRFWVKPKKKLSGWQKVFSESWQSSVLQQRNDFFTGWWLLSFVFVGRSLKSHLSSLSVFKLFSNLLIWLTVKKFVKLDTKVISHQKKFCHFVSSFWGVNYFLLVTSRKVSKICWLAPMIDQIDRNDHSTRDSIID